jgi:hypothetical protein
LANSMNPFIGRLALSGSEEGFLRAGDIGGLIMISVVAGRTVAGRREAMPWRSGGPPLPPLVPLPADRGPPGDGDNWSERSWL